MHKKRHIMNAMKILPWASKNSGPALAHSVSTFWRLVVKTALLPNNNHCRPDIWIPSWSEALMWSNSSILPPLNQKLVRLMMILTDDPHPWYYEVSGTMISTYPKLSPKKAWTPRFAMIRNQLNAPLFLHSSWSTPKPKKLLDRSRSFD